MPQPGCGCPAWQSQNEGSAGDWGPAGRHVMAYPSSRSTLLRQRFGKGQINTSLALGCMVRHKCAAAHIRTRQNVPVAVAALDDDGLAHRVEARNTHLHGHTVLLTTPLMILCLGVVAFWLACLLSFLSLRVAKITKQAMRILS